MAGFAVSDSRDRLAVFGAGAAVLAVGDGLWVVEVAHGPAPPAWFRLAWPGEGASLCPRDLAESTGMIVAVDQDADAVAALTRVREPGGCRPTRDQTQDPCRQGT